MGKTEVVYAPMGGTRTDRGELKREGAHRHAIKTP